LFSTVILVKHKEGVIVTTENVSLPDMVDGDDERDKAISTLQAAITDGVESGKPQQLDVKAFKLWMRTAKQQARYP
tara:strand:+ start:269 stop:496 length:228 start_codon:yes stop_codon:yes gene_type:complete